jgi:hypothetical protein
MPRLYSYLMTHDSGFAPNPFFWIFDIGHLHGGDQAHQESGRWSKNAGLWTS